MASRTALIEEGAVGSVHAKLIADRAPPQIGLVVGKRGVGARDLILALVPFPDWNAEKGDGDGDGGAPQPQRPASGGTPLHIDADSIVEHATQVTRMLPGGLDVVGAYAFAAEQAWRSASGALARAVVEAAEATAPERELEKEKEQSPEMEQFLLHLSAEDARKTSLRRVRQSTTAQPFSALPPAESREGKAFGNGVVRLETEYKFTWSVVIPSKRRTKKGVEKEHTLRSLLERACALETKRVMTSDALVENALWDDDVLIAAVPRREIAADDDQEKRSRSGDETDETAEKTSEDSKDVFALRAELLAPPRSLSCDACDSHDTTKESAVAASFSETDHFLRLTFTGVVSARAYASVRETVFEATLSLRRDVARSLRSRLDVLLDRADDALEDDDETKDNALSFLERRLVLNDDDESVRSPFAKRLAELLVRDSEIRNDSSNVKCISSLTLALPKRAWAEWLYGLSVCNYLAEGEKKEDVVARCAEVMRFDVIGGVKGVLLAERDGASHESGAVLDGANRSSNGKNDASLARRAETKSPAPENGKNPNASSSYAAYMLGAGVALVSAGLANLLMTDKLEIAECVGEMCEVAAEFGAQGTL